MKLMFLDMEYNSDCEIDIPTRNNLDAFIDDLRQKEPFIYELQCQHDHKLTNGISKTVGCIQFSHKNLNPPYLMAVTKTNLVNEDFEFMCGGTPTPVSPQCCLSIDEVKEIVWHFIETGNRYPDYNWEEM